MTITSDLRPRDDGETGDVDVDELRAALAAAPGRPGSDEEPPNPRRSRPRDRSAPSGRRRHRRWLVFAVVVLVVIVAGLVVGFFIWRSTADEVAGLRRPAATPR